MSTLTIRPSHVLGVIICSFVVICVPHKALSFDGLLYYHFFWGGEQIGSALMSTTHTVPLGVTRTAEVEYYIALGPDVRHMGELFYIPNPSTPSVRTHVETIGGYTGVSEFAWAQSGVYEMDFRYEQPDGSGGYSQSSVRQTNRFQINGTGVAAPGISLSTEGAGQYRVGGTVSIDAGETFVGNTAVFKAQVSDPNGEQVRMEVEFKKSSVSFDGSNTVVSELVDSGMLASTTIDNLIPTSELYIAGGNEGSFKWRARAVNESGVASGWQTYNSGSTAFSVKAVPLVTQIESDYPSRQLTQVWSGQDYADGEADKTGSCGLTIGQCGCALSSMVMLGYYYGITSGINGSSSNPLALDTWLLKNDGYHNKTNLIWDKALTFLGYEEDEEQYQRLTMTQFNTSSSTLVNAALAAQEPAVAFSSTYGHFFVLDSRLGTSTYTVRDPRWYNTRTLNDAKNVTQEVQAYKNVFTKANLFKQLSAPKKVAQSLTVYLASPAELLITAPDGRKLGYDPVSGVQYVDLLGNYTIEEPIRTSDEVLSNDERHEIKVLRLVEGANDPFELQVIGTGEGDYTLTLVRTYAGGETETEEIVQQTSAGLIDTFEIVLLLPEDDEEPEPEEPDQFQTAYAALINTIGLVDMSEKTRSQLLQRAERIARFVEREQYAQALNQLGNLEAYLERQVPKELTRADADLLLSHTEAIRAILTI